MSKLLPINNLKWMKRKELEKLDINEFEINQETGFMLEVDLEYPQELHDLRNDYPLAPEKMKSPWPTERISAIFYTFANWEM